MMGVNPTAPRFLAGVKLDGVEQWSPCNYCLWPNNGAADWELHMNRYHFPFAGNLQNQPIKWFWIIREVRDADHPLDLYFICEAVEKRPEPVKKAEAKKPEPKRPVLTGMHRRAAEMNRVFRAAVCSKCKTRHFQWETGLCKKARAKKDEEKDETQ